MARDVAYIIFFFELFQISIHKNTYFHILYQTIKMISIKASIRMWVMITKLRKYLPNVSVKVNRFSFYFGQDIFHSNLMNRIWYPPMSVTWENRSLRKFNVKPCAINVNPTQFSLLKKKWLFVFTLTPEPQSRQGSDHEHDLKELVCNERRNINNVPYTCKYFEFEFTTRSYGSNV